MKKLTNICLLLTSLIGYLEWGKDQHAFLFQAEAEIFSKATASSESLLHPFVLIPLLGQILILATVFQREPGRRLTFIGLACLSTIMLLLLFIGLISLNVRIAGSTIPFIVTGVWVLRNSRNVGGDRTKPM